MSPNTGGAELTVYERERRGGGRGTSIYLQGNRPGGRDHCLAEAEELFLQTAPPEAPGG